MTIVSEKPPSLHLLNTLSTERFSMRFERQQEMTVQTILLDPVHAHEVDIFRHTTICSPMEADLVDGLSINLAEGDPARLGDAMLDFFIDGESVINNRPRIRKQDWSPRKQETILRGVLGEEYRLPPPTLPTGLFHALKGEQWLGYMVPHASALVVRVIGLPGSAAGLVLDLRILTHRYTMKALTV